jgi:MerR family mercuric resistance operon transcriptional regulator
LTIGKLADAAGVNLEPVRYYERIGLMPPPGRSAGGHRVNDEEHLSRLTFIRRARELGFGIDAIRSLLALATSREKVPYAEVRVIAAAHLEQVRAKVADLARLEAILVQAVDQCQGDNAVSCPVLDALGQPLPA